jgi:hypothetical protein
MGHDLKGLIPESWCCIDCGFNTAPGLSTRAEMERAFETQKGGVKQTIDSDSEIYTVHNHVWQAAGMEPWGGCLCIGCLEKRLGHQLRPDDFPDHLCNSDHVPGTKRLLRRRTGDQFWGLTLGSNPPKAKLERPFDNIDWQSICRGAA